MFPAFCVCSRQTHLDPFCGVSGWLTSSGSSNICSRSSFDSSRSANWSTFDAIFTELSFSTEFPIVSLNYNFSRLNGAFLGSESVLSTFADSKFQILMPKLLLWSPEILTDTSMLCCVFLLLLLLLFSLHDGTFFPFACFFKPLSRLFNSKNLLLVIYFVRNVLFLKFWWKTFSGLLAVNWILRFGWRLDGENLT